MINRRCGFTLIEVMIAMLLLTIVALGIMRASVQMSRSAEKTKDHAFASEKTIQMMEELRGLVALTNNPSVGVLDSYDDGSTYNSVLTTHKEVTDPGDPTSGNGNRRYFRQVNIVQLPNKPLARRVYVRVFLAKTMEPLAQAVSIIYSIQNQYPSTQAYDVYVLAIENVPGWWSSLSTMRPTFDNIVQDLQTRDPGLQFSVHYITQLAYGRDPYYTPFINAANTLDSTTPSGIYFYPGLLSAGAGNTALYYVPTYFGGRVNIDGTTQGSYSIADEFNHAVRYPDEVRLYNQAVSQAQTNGTQPPQMSWRMLLETMNSSTTTVHNLLLVNLHGELLPMPPMRNYSDAAKDPLNYPKVRVVAHPQNLYYIANSSVSLRVYSYATNPSVFYSSSAVSAISIVIPSIALNSTNIQSVRIASGTSASGYSWQNAPATAGGGMWYTIAQNQPTNGQTLITLYNTPVISSAAANHTGLPGGYRLSGMEYIPCEVKGNTTFIEGSGDLADSTNNVPKNTARWVISFTPGSFPSGQYEFDVRIGTNTGSTGNTPTNLESTYIWIGSSIPPVTEQYQFLGDPRYMPYSDVKNNNGYNWWFADVSGGGYNGFGKTHSPGGYGWNGGSSSGNPTLGPVTYDVPRFFQILRSGLLKSGGIWTTMSGWSFFYMGIGGEMGDDGHINTNWTNGLPIVGIPWNTTDTNTENVNEIINTTWANNATVTSPRIVAKTDGSWAAIPWLGELYPDADFPTWAGTTGSTPGNLPTGFTNKYYRASYKDGNLQTATNNIFSNYAYYPTKRTAESGSASFFNGSPTPSSSQSLTHDSGSSNGNLTSTGITISQDFNFPLTTPLINQSTTQSDERPFQLTGTYLGPEWSDSVYSSQRTTTNLYEVYYDYNGSLTDVMSGMVRMSSGTQVATFDINGVANQSNFGTFEIGKLIMIGMTRAYMQAGNPTITTGSVTPVPLVSVSSPAVGDQYTDPSTIPVSWSIKWIRWDGNAYTSMYPANYTNATSLVVNIKYSNNTGKNWYFVQDGQPAILGTADIPHDLSSTSSYSWNISSFPAGDYLVQVETYRQPQNYPLHYTYQQREFYVIR
jgi:prepilin-type N-terminal cleavage/methylation domain-containing protein